MDKAERIRNRIEELLNDWKYMSSTEAKYRCEVYKELLEDIDFLQEEPVSDELEKAAEQDVCEVVNCCSAVGIPNDHIPSWVQDAMINEFIRGANWQKAKDQETIELAEDHAMLAGMEKMKEEMMANAMDCEISWYDGPYLDYTREKEDDALAKINASVGDKVKVIILKDE